MVNDSFSLSEINAFSDKKSTCSATINNKIKLYMVAHTYKNAYAHMVVTINMISTFMVTIFT